MTTIHDVAKLAGVSPITASRALNKPDMVRPSTLQRVKEAADRLGYQPNFVARSLRTGQTRIVTLVVNQKTTYDPLMFEFATGVSESCRAHGYSLLIYPAKEPNSALDELIGKVDGLILTDIADQDSRVEDLLGKIPIAIFGESRHRIPQVDIDDAWGAMTATEHLLGLGYRDIVMVTSDVKLLFLKHRMQGYSNSMISAGLTPKFAFGSLDILGGEAAMGTLDQLPEAVLCVSDSMAIGVMRYLNLRNLQIPVVGYDGGYLGEITTPTLTSVKQPFYTAGEQLAQGMFQHLRSRRSTKQVIRPTLVIRESTWPKAPDTAGES
ncbi:LacI family DNA-binding transcriptional regulator [Alicyclobacillus fodiniaquatilis]|jgi:LacI family transcriptional regulator|uniref:LacI family DNA-binding transcriptional regulator n=1 Tax=Alicyclobacillus fodiniaquatilis TaxID=1661150 RepID=A0ABW4JJD5_9BACL